MKEDLVDGFYENYMQCKEEFSGFFQKNSFKILYSHKFNYLIPQEEKLTPDIAATISTDLIIFLLFIKTEHNFSLSELGDFFELDLFMNYFISFKKKFRFSNSFGSKNLPGLVITPEIFSFIGEKSIIESEKLSNSSSGTIFTGIERYGLR